MRAYTEEQIATALAALQGNGGNAKRTAKQLAIPLATLRGWAGKNTKSSGKPKKVSVEAESAAQARLAQKFTDFADLALDAAPERIEKMGGKDLLISAAVATEKALLLTGRPTSRSESATIVYVQPTALRDMSGEVIEGTFRTDSGTKALAAGADV